MNPVGPKPTITFKAPVDVKSQKHGDNLTRIEATIAYEDKVFTVTLKHRLGSEDDINQIFSKLFETISRDELDVLDGKKFKAEAESQEILEGPVEKREEEPRRDYKKFERLETHVHGGMPASQRAHHRVQWLFERVLPYKDPDAPKPTKETTSNPSTTSLDTSSTGTKTARAEFSVKSTPTSNKARLPADDASGLKFGLRESPAPGLFERVSNWFKGESTAKAGSQSDEMAVEFEEVDDKVNDEDTESINSDTEELEGLEESTQTPPPSTTTPSPTTSRPSSPEVTKSKEPKSVEVPLIQKKSLTQAFKSRFEKDQPQRYAKILSLQKANDFYAIKGEGHCLFRAMGTGLLFQLQANPTFIDFLKEKMTGFSKKDALDAALESLRATSPKTPEEIISNQTQSDLIVEWLRWLACEHNQKHIGDEKYLFSLSKDVLGQEPADYFSDMKNMEKKKDGGDQEINAIAEELGIDMIIYDPRNDAKEIWSIQNTHSPSFFYVQLLLTGNHYDLLVPVLRSETSPPLRSSPVSEAPISRSFPRPPPELTQEERLEKLEEEENKKKAKEFREKMKDYNFDAVEKSKREQLTKKEKKELKELNKDLNDAIELNEFEIANKIINLKLELLYKYRGTPETGPNNVIDGLKSPFKSEED